MKAILLTDISSKGKGLTMYGKKGDQVEIISWHDEIAIVEGKNKNRFSVKKENLKILE